MTYMPSNFPGMESFRRWRMSGASDWRSDSAGQWSFRLHSHQKPIGQTRRRPYRARSYRADRSL